jgi:uncharacterized membrane protein YidH (DUF202 family)
MNPVARGLTVERTALAWRRTGLGLSVGSLAAGRLLGPAIGDLAGLLAVAGVAAGLGLLLGGRHRAAAIERGLRAPGGLVAGPGAGLLVAVAVVAVGVGIVGLVVTLGGR